MLSSKTMSSYAARSAIAPNSVAFTILLGVLAGLPVLSIDISAPTLVLLPKALQTTSAMAGLTLSLFMGGFALGQVGGGNLSDLRGRRPVLLTGLAIYAAAGLACALAASGIDLVIARFVQGAAAGACSVLSFAIVQDLFQGEAARSKRVLVTVVFGVVPIFAPSLGALASDVAGWRLVHVLLALAGVLLLGITWLGMAESRPAAVRKQAKPGGTRRLLGDIRFVALATANALSYGAVFAYVAGSPVVIMAEFGLSSEIYAAIFAVTALSLTFGAFSSSRFVRRGVSVRALLTVSFIVMAVSAVVLTLISTSTVPAVLLISIPVMMVMLFARGVISPNLQHLAIERHRDCAGAASAAVGVSQLLSAAFASALVSALLPLYGPVALAIPMAALTTVSLGVGLWAIRSP